MTDWERYCCSLVEASSMDAFPEAAQGWALRYRAYGLFVHARFVEGDIPVEEHGRLLQALENVRTKEKDRVAAEHERAEAAKRKELIAQKLKTR